MMELWNKESAGNGLTHLLIVTFYCWFSGVTESLAKSRGSRVPLGLRGGLAFFYKARQDDFILNLTV